MYFLFKEFLFIFYSASIFILLLYRPYDKLLIDNILNNVFILPEKIRNNDSRSINLLYSFLSFVIVMLAKVGMYLLIIENFQQTVARVA